MMALVARVFAVLLTLSAATLEKHDVELLDPSEIPAVDGKAPVALAMHITGPRSTWRNTYWNDFALDLFRDLWQQDAYYPIFGKLPMRSSLLDNYTQSKVIRTMYAQQTTLLLALNKDGRDVALPFPVLHSAADPTFTNSCWGPVNVGLAFFNQHFNASEVPLYDFWIAGSHHFAQQLKEAGAKKVHQIELGVHDVFFEESEQAETKQQMLQSWIASERADEGGATNWASALEKATSGIENKFVIYSANPASLGNGQDIVLRSFLEFLRKHPNDAFLVANWFQPFPAKAKDTFNADGAGNLTTGVSLGARETHRGATTAMYNIGLYESGLLKSGCYDWASWFSDNTAGAGVEATAGGDEDTTALDQALNDGDEDSGSNGGQQRWQLGDQPLLRDCGLFAPGSGFGDDEAVAAAAAAMAGGDTPPVLLLSEVDDVTEARRALRLADVAVFPNRELVGPNVDAMQAMATGTPTIISDVPGHRELLRPADVSSGSQSESANDVPEHCYVLQSWADGAAVAELVGSLERVYADFVRTRDAKTDSASTEAERKGAAAAAFMRARQLTRAGTAARIAQVLTQEGVEQRAVAAGDDTSGGDGWQWDANDAQRLLEQGDEYEQSGSQVGAAQVKGVLIDVSDTPVWQIVVAEGCAAFLLTSLLLTLYKKATGGASAAQRKAVRALLLAIYRRYAPEKVKNVDSVLVAYSGSERLLLKRLQGAYFARGSKAKGE
eukprot:g1747.t1